MSTYEQDIIDKHGDPRLKRNELERFAKKEHLNSQGMSKLPEERDELLDKIYGPEDKSENS